VKILHLYKNALPQSTGGVETMIDALASYTTEKGHFCKVIVVSESHDSGTFIYNGYEVKVFKQDFGLQSNPFSLSWLKSVFVEIGDYDIVHHHYPFPSGDLSSVLFQFKGTKFITTYHSDIIKQRILLLPYLILRMLFFYKVDAIVATSENYLKTSVQLKNWLHKAEVIPIGIKDPTIEKRTELHYSFINDKKPFFLFLGEARHYKGLNFLIKAAGMSSSYNLVLAGFTARNSEINELIKKYGNGNIVLLGHISQEAKNSLLAQCLGVVCASNNRAEAFGLSLVEGAAFSKPLISCEISTGTSFVNINQETGLVVPHSDEVRLFEAMNYLVKNKSEAKRMGENGRLRYQKLFTYARMGEQYLTIYKKMLSK